MELKFTMRFVDMVSNPINKLNQHIGNMAGHMRSSFRDMGMGAAGMWGSQHLTKKLLDPAVEYSRAERAVKSLGASKATLKSLGDIAMHSSNEFGMGASHIVESAYAIQGGMGAALTEGALPRIANAADIMAKAVRTSNETATSYVASTYGVFSKYADKMGQAKFAERLAGQTALAVRTYRTTGQEMSSAFATMGSTGSANGQSLESQMAVLGNLQSMGLTGTVAGTQYEQFLTGIKHAGKTLGMSFSNRDGSLQDITVILDKLHKRFGDLSKIKDQNLLKKALGSDVAVKFLLNMISKVPKLTKEIGDLNKVSGLGVAEEMAKDQVIGWDRLKQSISNVNLAIGQGLNPALEPLANKMADIIGSVGQWLHDFPNIARWFGYMTIAITGFTAAASGLFILKGFTKLLGFGTLGKDITLFKLLWKIFARFSGIEMLISVFMGLAKAWQYIRTAGFAMYMMLKTLNAGLILTRISTVALATWSAICTAATWAWGAATAFLATAMQILLSPVTLVILGIAALAAGIYYAIENWDSLKASIMNSSVFQTLMGWGLALANVFSGVWDSIKAGWQLLLNSLMAGYNWIIGKLNAIPGVNLTPMGADGGQPNTLPALPNSSAVDLPKGGLKQETANNQNASHVDQSRKIDTVNINVQQMPSPAALQEYQEMAAG